MCKKSQKLKKSLIAISLCVCMVLLSACAAEFSDITKSYKNSKIDHDTYKTVEKAVMKERAKHLGKLYAITFDTDIGAGTEVSSILLKFNETNEQKVSTTYGANVGGQGTPETVYTTETKYIRLTPSRTMTEEQMSRYTEENAQFRYTLSLEDMGLTESFKTDIETSDGQVMKNVDIDAVSELKGTWFFNEYLGSFRGSLGEVNIDSDFNRTFANTDFPSYMKKDGYKLHDELYDRIKNAGGEEEDGEIKIKYGDSNYHTAFESGSTQVVYFRTTRDMNNFKEMELLLNGGDGYWALSNINIYEVTEVLPNMSSSVASTDVYSNFKGKRLYRLMNVEPNGVKDYFTVNDSSKEGAVMGNGDDAQLFLIDAIQEESKVRDRSKPYLLKSSDTEIKKEVEFANLDNSQFTVEMRIADVKNAGFSNLYRNADTGKFDLKEQLRAEINYTTLDGKKRYATVPVITNALLKYFDSKGYDIANNVDNRTQFLDNIKNGNVFSIAQQGEKLFFDVNLPRVKTIDNIKFDYIGAGGNGAQIEDFVSISDILIYEKDKAPSIVYNDITLSADYKDITTDTPDRNTVAYYYTAKSYEGEQIMDYDTAPFVLQKTPTVDGFTTSRKTDNLYMATIRTSDIKSAQTTENVSVKFNYVDTKGRDASTQEYSIYEALDDYYGYWKGVFNPKNVPKASTDENADSSTDGNTEDTSTETSTSFDSRKAEVLSYCIKMGLISADKLPPGYNTSEDSTTGDSTAGDSTTDDTELYATLDAAPFYALTRGNEFNILFSVNDVENFTGITVSMDKDCKTQWQISDFKLINVETLGKRKLYNIDATYSANGTATYALSEPTDGTMKSLFVNGIWMDRAYQRDVKGNTLFESNPSEPLNIFVQPGDNVTYDFESDKKDYEYEDRNYTDEYYSMKYETAAKDLGFDTTDKSYEVRINVPNNSEMATFEDSCGSKNLFYFQIIFEQGKSAYVLANTQLTSDGFIAGTTSVFTVGTNRDMGDAVAVNIIPDDIDSNSDILDKLCIDSIEIIKHNKNGIDKRYICNNVGWIGRDYKGSADKDMVVETEGRSELELAVVVPVDVSEYSLNYEFAITTGQYSGDDTLNGALLADIGYYNSKGELKTIRDFDVVEAIYKYRNNTNPNKELENEAVKGYCMIDPETMFRPDTTDRFVISIPDATSIKSIYLRPICETAVTWTIKNIAVNVIKSEGSLYLNSSDEYQKKYELDPELLVEAITNVTMPYNMVTYGDWLKSGVKLQFKDNTVPQIKEEDGSLISVATREPISKNDKVNIYVYFADGTSDPNGAIEYDVTAELRYSASKYDYSNKATLIKGHSDDGLMMYYTGLEAPGFLTLNDLVIKANTVRDSTRDISAIVTGAVVQQVRSGVVIDTYSLSYANADIMTPGGANVFSKKTAQKADPYQEVGLSLGIGTDNVFLKPMEYDMAVSISYTSLNDPQGTGKEYSSPYIYLTDQEIDHIKAGDLVTLKFKEAFIKDITKVKLIANNGLKVNVKNGYISMYPNDTSAPTMRYAISGGDVTKYGNELSVSSRPSDILNKVTLTFETSEAVPKMNVGNDDQVNLTLTYEDSDGHEYDYRVESAEQYLPYEKDFSAGSESTICLLVPNIAKLRILEVETKDSWTLKSVATTVEDPINGKKKASSAVDKTIYETEPCKINFTDIVIDAKVTWGNNEEKTSNGVVNVLANVGDTVKIDAEILHSLAKYGYNVRVDKVVPTADGEAVNKVGESKGEGKNCAYAYVVPEWAKDTTCRITIISGENPDVTCVVNITALSGSSADSE